MGEIAILTSGKWIGVSDGLAHGHKLWTPLVDADVAIVGTQRLEYYNVKHLKGIVRLGVGYDNVPLDECRKAGIVLAYTPNAPSQSVAEHAFALMMAALRFRDRTRPGKMLNEITVAIIGRGRIGKRFAAMLSAFSVDMMAVDPISDTTFDEIHKIVRTDFNTAIRSADVISLHVPLNDDTRNMINQSVLEEMPDDGILINTARAGIVKESDLASHLERYSEFTAALDVFEQDGIYRNTLFMRNSALSGNCIHTPHVAAMTVPARRAMEYQAITAAVAILRGEKPRWPIPEREPWQ